MPDPALTEALVITFDYLKAGGQVIGHDTEQLVAGAILSAWLRGTRHRIRLANAGIAAIERSQRKPLRKALKSCQPLSSVYRLGWGSS
jgi:hypothetical protein